MKALKKIDYNSRNLRKENGSPGFKSVHFLYKFIRTKFLTMYHDDDVYGYDNQVLPGTISKTIID